MPQSNHPAITRSAFVRTAGAATACAALGLVFPGIVGAWAEGASQAGKADASVAPDEPVALDESVAPEGASPFSAAVAESLGTRDFAGSLPDPHLYIMVATDMHFISPRLTDHGPFFEELVHNSDAKLMDYSEEIVDVLVEAAFAEKPDVLVIPGDLTYNGARESHGDIVAKLARIREAGIPVVVIPGNHDIECPQAARFEGDGYELVESIGANEFAELYADFGYAGDATLARDDASLSYVWELDPGLRLLMLDVNGTPSLGTAPQGTAAPETIEWVAGQLADAAAAGARVIAVSHQSMLQQTFIDYGYVVDNAQDVLEHYKDAGVLLNLCGHLHLQHFEIDGDGFVDVATSALSVSPCQFARVTVTPLDRAEGVSGVGNWLAGPLRVDYRTVPMDVAVSALATENNDDNPDLLDFAAYGKTFFMGDGTRRQALAAGLEEAGFANATELAEFSSEVNYHYFTGRLDQMEYRPDLIEAWNQVDALTGYYMRYIFETQQVRNQNDVSVDVPAS